MRKFLLIILFCICLVPLFDLFHPGLPVTHDGKDHVARIANFYQNISEGILIPRWAPNLNWGYGHPILMFLFPLPSYLASFFHFFGFSFIDSTKIVFGLTYVLSGLAMYVWVKEFLGKQAGIAASVLYLFAPYRFIDLYVRGAIGEHVAFLFVPLVFYFLLKLSKKQSLGYVGGASLSLAGLILSHNAISLMFFPLFLLYFFYLSFTIRKKKHFIFSCALAALFGLSFCAFFWIPAFFEGRYTLRDIVTKGGYAKHFAEFSNFFYGPWSYGGSGMFTVQLGIIHWFLFFLSVPFVFVYRKKKYSIRFLAIGAFVITFVALFLMTQNASFLWQKITILQKFQFPWRLLSVVVLTTSLLGGIVVSLFSERVKNVVVIVLVMGILFVNREYFHAKSYMYRPDSFFNVVYDGTTDTGESAPIWSVRFMEKRPNAHIEVIDGSAGVKEVKRTTSLHAYSITAQEKSRIRENTLYFPGWGIYVDGKQTDIQFQDPKNRGLITFYIEKGEHTVSIVLRETKLRLFSDILSVASVLLFFCYSIFKPKLLWKRFR